MNYQMKKEIKLISHLKAIAWAIRYHKQPFQAKQSKVLKALSDLHRITEWFGWKAP